MKRKSRATTNDLMIWKLRAGHFGMTITDYWVFHSHRRILPPPANWIYVSLDHSLHLPIRSQLRLIHPTSPCLVGEKSLCGTFTTNLSSFPISVRARSCTKQRINYFFQTASRWRSNLYSSRIYLDCRQTLRPHNKSSWCVVPKTFATYRPAPVFVLRICIFPLRLLCMWTSARIEGVWLCSTTCTQPDMATDCKTGRKHSNPNGPHIEVFAHWIASATFAKPNTPHQRCFRRGDISIVVRLFDNFIFASLSFIDG